VIRQAARTDVVVYQETFLHYRYGFFDLVARLLRERGLTFQVLEGRVQSRVRDLSAWERADERSTPWLISVPAWRYDIGRASFRWAQQVFESVRDDGVVVVPEFSGFLPTYPRLVRPRERRFHLACWGIGPGPGDGARHPLGRWARSVIVARYDWWFAYTEKGRGRLIDHGVSPQEITVLGNTVDTAKLRTELDEVAEEQVLSFRSSLGASERLGVCIGALTDYKLIPFLLETLPGITSRYPGFHLVIAGDGPLRSEVEAAARLRQDLTYVGPAFDRDKALLLRASDVLIQPGRIGLIAVESLLSGTPLITIESDAHGPEFDYLEPNVDCVVVERSEDYVDAVISLLHEGFQLDRLAGEARQKGAAHSIENMAAAFVDGVVSLRARGRRGSQ
jgi:glycosyltransferase involved in cell wall biosynthesis